MPAFELALAQGAEMLEFDVRPTADNQIIVFHDDTTERWNGQAHPIETLTLAAIQQVDIRGATVPTLDTLLDWARTTNLALNIEIKVPGIELAVARMIHDHGLTERVIISAFDPNVLLTMRSVAPELPRAALMGAESFAPHVRFHEDAPLRMLQRLSASAWHPDWRLPLLDQLIPRVRAAGNAVNVWTVDDPQIMRRLLALNVEGIITNKPALLKQVMQEWAATRAPAT